MASISFGGQTKLEVRTPRARIVQSPKGIGGPCLLSLQTCVAFLLVCSVLSGQQPSDPLVKALELADLYNWADSESWFEAAKASAGPDQRRALYADIGLLRSSMERRVLPQASEWLGQQLRDNPLLQGDDELRLFAWMVRADIDFEIDARPARRDWQEVLAMAERRNDPKWIRRARTELGFVAFVEGDISSAAFTVMTGINAATQARDAGAQIRYLTAMGTGLIITKSYQLGLDRVEQALAVEAAHQPQAGYNFPAREAKVMALFGLKRNDEGLRLAAEILSAARARQKRVKECQVLLTLGKYFRAEGNKEQANAHFSQARQLAEAGGFQRFFAEASNALAMVSASEGDSKRALQLASAAADATLASGDVYFLPDRLQSLARIQTSVGDRAQARRTYEAAEAAAAFILGWTSTVSSRTAMVNTLSALYKDHFVLLAEDGDVANAFRVLETTRARTMRALLAGERLSTTGRVSEERIGSLRADLARSESVQNVNVVNAAFEREQATEWSPLQKKLVESASLKETQAALGPKSVLIEYALAEPNSYCVVVTRASARIVPLKVGERALTRLVERYNQTLKEKREDAALAQELAAQLLGSISELANHPDVLISRDGPLHLLPFEALMLRGRVYLVMTHDIAYIPSATTVGLLRQAAARRPANTLAMFLGVGGLPYDTSSRPRVATTRGYEAQLGNLPGSATEIRNAANIAEGKATLLLGKQGTETAFKTAAPNHRIIHLAVHGRANSLYPEKAALVLLPDPETKEDGLLVSTEIVDLQIAADLVVLSACDSGVGMLLGQDGVANLSRAFLAGGTRTVVSTLWAADDVSATSLLKRFYGYLATRANVSQALTRSKRELIRTFGAAPYFWAPYIVEGVPGVTLK